MLKSIAFVTHDESKGICDDDICRLKNANRHQTDARVFKIRLLMALNSLIFLNVFVASAFTFWFLSWNMQ